LADGRVVVRSKITSLTDAAALVEDGCRLGFGGQPALYRRPMAFVRQLVRDGRRRLHLFNQIGGLEVDLLLGAGAVASTNCCYVGLDDLGQSPHFQRAAREHRAHISEYTEFTLVASLRAAGMGLPFIPWKTGWGTEVAERQGWRTIACPYTGMELLAIPANRLDVAVVQVRRCDEFGNVERPAPLDISHDFDELICRAADRVIVCAEVVEPLADLSRTGLAAPEVTCVVHAPRGAWPCGMSGAYPPDLAHLAQHHLPAAASDAAFAHYLEDFVAGPERPR
jgi:glutaconate CoA-transferase subunit A